MGLTHSKESPAKIEARVKQETEEYNRKQEETNAKILADLEKKTKERAEARAKIEAKKKFELEEKEFSNRFADLPQSSEFLNGLKSFFERHHVESAIETVKLLDRNAYRLDPNCTFSGCIEFKQHDHYRLSLFQAWANMCEGKYRRPETYDDRGKVKLMIDGVKPYLLAFMFSLFDDKWLEVFTGLLKYSNVDIKNDKVFGLSGFYQMNIYLAPQGGIINSIKMDRVIFRQIYKNVVFDSKKLINVYIRDHYYALLEDILEVCDCKELLSTTNFLFDIATHMESTALIPMFLKKGQDVFQKIDNEYCFTVAIKKGNSSNLLFYLDNYDILPYLEDGILHTMYEKNLTYNCFAKIISKAKEGKRNIVQEKDRTGRSILRLICETNKDFPEDRAQLIRLLIKEGANIYESFNGKRVIDIIFSYGLPRFVNRMMDWSKEYELEIAPPAVILRSATDVDIEPGA